MNRALYLSIADGSIAGQRFFTKSIEEPSDKQKQHLAKRYNLPYNWKRIREADTLKKVAAAFFERARAMMMRDGIHHSFVFLLRGETVIQMIRADHPTRASRYVLMRDLAKLARIAEADGVMYVGETWTAHGDGLPKSGFAIDAEDRGEAVMLSVVNDRNEHYQFISAINRKRPGSPKVKSMGLTEIETDGFPFMFAPFLLLWGCLDEEEMNRSFEAMDQMGIETPRLNE